MTSRALLRSLLAASLLVGALVAPAARAADGDQALALYLFGAGMDGELGVGPVTGDLDVSFSDIWSNLDFGAMAAYRIDKGRWATAVDLIYMSLEAQKSQPLGVGQIKGEADQLVIEADAIYKVSERFEAIFGLRYNDIESTIRIEPDFGDDVSAGAGESWIDPVVGGRLILPMGKSWRFVARGDIGGFGIGSDFAWQALARFDWIVSDKVDILFGYRVIDADYEDGDGSDRFLYDVQSSGPMAGVTLKF